MDAITKVKTFNLYNEEDKEDYQVILNSEFCSIFKEQFTYTKSGLPMITIWYREDIVDNTPLY